jgi:hypothetical protein
MLRIDRIADVLVLVACYVGSSGVAKGEEG